MSGHHLLSLIEQEMERLRALPTHLSWGKQTPDETLAIQRCGHRLELLIELLEPEVNKGDLRYVLTHPGFAGVECGRVDEEGAPLFAIGLCLELPSGTLGREFLGETLDEALRAAARYLRTQGWETETGDGRLAALTLADPRFSHLQPSTMYSSEAGRYVPAWMCVTHRAGEFDYAWGLTTTAALAEAALALGLDQGGGA